MKTICHHIATAVSSYRSQLKLFKPGWLWLILLLLPCSSRAQETNDYTVHANIIYHFTKYIDWPAEKKSGDFIIGVMGDSMLYDELQKSMTNKTVGSQKIVIRKISSATAAKDCHILFVSEEMSSSMKKIVTQTNGSSVLLVTEQDGLAKRGACINFIIVSDHLKLEINTTNIEQHNLSIASELLKLGKIVK